MKNWITTSLAIFGILTLSQVVKAQDYNDIGRTKEQEFSILKFNGYKMEKIHSNDAGTEIYLAKRPDQKSQYNNVITIDKNTQTVVSVVWNFDQKNFGMIKSLLSDMNATDASGSQLENKKGLAQLTLDPDNHGLGMVVWKKKS